MTAKPKRPGATKTVVIWVTATAHLYRHPRGSVFQVDATTAEIQAALEQGWLIPVGEPDELQVGD